MLILCAIAASTHSRSASTLLPPRKSAFDLSIVTLRG
jgi:hypothetical protein